MNKESKKQKALELFRSGISYGEISRQIGEAKSTIHRWIKEFKKENRTIETPGGTAGTPSGTGFAVDHEENGTNSGTTVPKTAFSGTTGPKKRNEHSPISDNPNEFEFLKAKLDHEYQMAKLSFEKEQYRDKKKAEADVKEMERLKQDLKKAIKNNEELQHKQNNGQHQIVIEIPQSYISELANLLRQYLNYDEEECSIVFIESLDGQVRGLESKIVDWANDNNYNLDGESTMNIIEKIISDIQETINYFEEEEADILQISFNKAWKTEMEDWLDTITN